MMPRVFMVWLLLASTMGYLVYQMKYEVQSREEKLNKINREIVEEEETTRILNAEWAYLNQPRQIDQAAQRLTTLAPVRNVQIVDLSKIPMRGETAPPVQALPAPATEAPVDLDTEGPSEGVPDDADQPPADPRAGQVNAADPKTLLMVRTRGAHDH